jgi:hypothetical protein
LPWGFQTSEVEALVHELVQGLEKGQLNWDKDKSEYRYKTQEIIQWIEQLTKNEILLCKHAGVGASPAMAT